MFCHSWAVLALAVVLSLISAHSLGYEHVPAHVARGANLNSNDPVLTEGDRARLQNLQFSGNGTGVNALSEGDEGVWIGSDGPYINEFSNDSGEDTVLVIWGPDASWVNQHQPLITVSLPSGSSIFISFASGAIGAWSALYPDTTLQNGQIANTWGEYTFSDMGVFDISRLVNMAGHNMSIVAPSCTSDMNTCVFLCLSGTVCEEGYTLDGCADGSQPGATYGTDSNGAPSGGCGGLGTGAQLKTTLG